jgi:prepilin-type N-terminal cleavage/methylation domain-containing protein
MKKGLTLIELIFTIIIIAVVFSVIPKIIYISNESLKFSKKEDAIFNMMAKMMDISLKEYDYNNTLYDDILLAHNPAEYILDCNASTGYRIGGFAGSRNCKNKIPESFIPFHTSGEYDYIEGYNGVEENLSFGHTFYILKIKVGYTDEWHSYGSGTLSFNFTKRMDNNKTNIKRVYITVSTKDKNLSSISYYSANIGHIKINKVRW